MKARELMTGNPACATPGDSARSVAQLMAENDCGCIPVVEASDNSRVVGIVTDRDLALRGIAKGKGPNTPVRELMTSDLCCCSPDDDLEIVERAMAEQQIRRVIVVDGDGVAAALSRKPISRSRPKIGAT